MRKISLLLALAVASFSAFAQYNTSVQEAQSAKTDGSELAKPTTQSQNKALNTTTVLHSFDFTGGMPAGWTVEDDAGIGGWVVQSGNVQAAEFVGPAGHTINSTSGGEYLCMPVEFYNTQAGSNPPEDNANLVEGDSRVTTDWMDVTEANGAVALQYEFWGRHWYGEFKIYVYINDNATDNVLEFNALYPNGEEWVANSFPPANSNPELAIWNISDALPGTTITNVKIAFRFYSTSHYVVSLDDIAIVDIVGNDVGISRTYATSFGIYTISDTYSDGTAGLYEIANYGYSEVPANLIAETSLGTKIHQYAANGEGVSINFSRDSADATNNWDGVSTTTIASFGPDSILHTDTVGGAMDFVPQYYKPALDQAWFQTNGFYENGIPYVYHYEAVATATDDDPANNTSTFQFAQTWGRYSYHNQSSDPALTTNIGRNSLHGLTGFTPTQGQMMVNDFECYPAEGDEFKIYGVRFWFASDDVYTTFDASGNSVSIQPVIYRYDGSAWVEFTDVLYDNPDGSGDVYTLHESEQDSWIYLPFDNSGGDVDAATFPAGQYRVGILIKNYNGQRFSVGVDRTTPQDDGHSGIKIDAAWSRMASNGSVMIDMYTRPDQMVYDKALGITEKAQNTINKVSIYPNPTTGVIKVKHAQNASIYVYSIAGNLVKTVKSNAVSTTVDLSEFAKGTYLVKVVKENEVLTKKVNLLK